MQAILSLNTGSSSVKFALYAAQGNQNPKILCRGAITGITNTLLFSATDANRALLAQESIGDGDFEKAFNYLLHWIKETFHTLQLKAAGHRIVHGGAKHTQSVQINQEVLQYLESLIPLAPLHQPHNLAGIRALQALHPTLPQIACFDTSFHSTQPPLATLFALPQNLTDEGIRRYGFHGLSYQYIANVLPEYVGKKAEGKVVVAHLGHGASMCALKDSRSMATTMGFTALDGLPMGTRSGTIDPGVILYLLEEKSYTVKQITDLLYNQSGLLGLSGISDDVRDLLNSGTPPANKAIDYFCYRIQRELGSLVAALGGLDVLVFTAGIGENSPDIRQKVCEASSWLNIEIDLILNNAVIPSVPSKISHSKSQVDVWVIPTNEELMIANDTFVNSST